MTETPITWQEAVARLTRDRTLAVAAAERLVAVGSAEAVARGAVRYAEAKAEYDGVIAGLSVALAQRHGDAALPGLEVRLRAGVAALEALRAEVAALPAVAVGQKSWVIDLATVLTAGPVIEALKAIWLRVRDDNALTRKTIETQLQAAVWPEFRTIVPAG